jgi:transposase
MADRALKELSPWFDQLYAKTGRPSIPPEQLLRAQILQALYTIRSERQLMDQIDGNWRYRWFVGLKIDSPVWDVTVFTKNRDRLLEGEVAQKFFEQVRGQAQAAGLLDDEHFTVDGTLLEAWASRQSFEPKKDPPQRGSGIRGRKLLRDTHESKTDPQARLYHVAQITRPERLLRATIFRQMRHERYWGTDDPDVSARIEAVPENLSQLGRYHANVVELGKGLGLRHARSFCWTRPSET